VCSGYMFTAETKSGSWGCIKDLGFYRAYAVEFVGVGVPVETCGLYERDFDVLGSPFLDLPPSVH